MIDERTKNEMDYLFDLVLSTSTKIVDHQHAANLKILEMIPVECRAEVLMTMLRTNSEMLTAVSESFKEVRGLIEMINENMKN